MFYLEDKFITYPSRSVVEDVITRDGPPDKNSFTPYYGCRDVIMLQFGKKEGNFNLPDFLCYVSGQDFTPSRVRKEVEYAEDEIPDYSDKETAGFTTLESVDDNDHVRKHVTNLIIGYKINKDSPYRNNDVREVMYMTDDESGESFSPGELKTIRDNIDLDQFLEIQKKLPYLLKMLHQGSIYYGIHLLSFLRAYEICKTMGKWMPQDFGAQGVYKMNRDGHIGRLFVHADDNKIPTYYPYGRKWASGEFPNDSYYKAAQEFLNILYSVGVDIKLEDPTRYDKEFIDSIVCTYIANNESYLESFGYVDPAIITALNPQNIFKSRVQKLDTTQRSEVRKSMNTLAEIININIDVLKLNYGKLFNTPNVDDINEYLRQVAVSVGSIKPHTVSEFHVQGNLLVGRTGNFVVCDVRPIGLWDYVNMPDGSYKVPTKKAVLTISGLLILLEDEADYIQYISCREAANILKGVEDAKRWTTLRFES